MKEFVGSAAWAAAGTAFMFAGGAFLERHRKKTLTNLRAFLPAIVCLALAGMCWWSAMKLMTGR